MTLESSRIEDLKRLLKNITQQALEKLLSDDGFDDAAAVRALAKSGDFGPLIAKFVGQKILEAGVEKYAAARECMWGGMFISPQEMENLWGFTYTPDQLEQLWNDLPDQKELELLQDGQYLLLPGPNRPLTLPQVHAMKEEYFFKKGTGWHDRVKKQYLEEVVAPGWYKISRHGLQKFSPRPLADQEKLLNRDEEFVPTVVQWAWAAVTFFMVDGQQPFNSSPFRTSSVSGDGKSSLAVCQDEIRGKNPSSQREKYPLQWFPLQDWAEAPSTCPLALARK